MKRRWSLVPTLVLIASFVAAGCTTSESPGPDDPTDDAAVRLSFGVFGTPDEIAGYQAMVDAYNAKAMSTRVDLVSWSDNEAMMGDIDAGTDSPDLFMVARADLAHVVETGQNTPLYDLLEARNISYGDGFSFDAVEAFSADNDLQCMPYSVSPMVIYYNKDLIDFEKMRERGLPAPVDELEGWNFEEFRAAAAFATRKRAGTRGVSIEPSLRSLAPFLLSGGGAVFNDNANPTSLAFSDGGNVGTLITALELLRDPQLTLGSDQLAEAPSTEWFEDDKLGMIEGFRSLTPELRSVPGLRFDVMPMPRIDDDATVGDITGLCITPNDNVQNAADFLVHAISDEGFAPVTEAGYVVPANLTVARSDIFLQPALQPANAGVFNASVDNMKLLPLLDNYDELNAAVAPLLEELLNTPLIDLDELTAQIDNASRSVLDPDYVPEPDPSSDSTESSG